jgi:hypothetical protein
VGAQEYLLVASQGVTGFLAAAGFAPDSGQFTAQLAGVGAIVGFALVIGWVMMAAANFVVRVGGGAGRVTNPRIGAGAGDEKRASNVE